MCVGIPMLVTEVAGDRAVAELDGVRREASLVLLRGRVRTGDYVIVHAGFAIAVLDEAEALETLALVRSFLESDG
jgi:hydrogenase expression/formation protein HypC